jgi:hypothetical protein
MQTNAIGSHEKAPPEGRAVERLTPKEVYGTSITAAHSARSGAMPMAIRATNS